ncbi:MAG: deaminase-reductase protein [Actinoallomurus sp.]|jgi:dihydrofolate reductase|nr:deaminase-reductase protein [Actinoallomurus sp.]
MGRSTLLEGDLAEALTELKRRPGKNIQVPGSPRLVRSLLREGLLDQLALMIHPLVLGTGARLFEDEKDRRKLRLVDSRTLSTGVVSVTYEPA